jgi:hypothetical protein
VSHFNKTTKRNATKSTGSNLQGVIDSICPLGQGLCVLHALFQSVQPVGFKIQIVKQFNPAGPDLLKCAKEKSNSTRDHTMPCISRAVGHPLQGTTISFTCE